MATTLTTTHPQSIFYTKALSTATLGLILGSATWASVAVMLSIIAAPLSTHSKLSVFDGLIVRANAVLPPFFIAAASSLVYLSYYYSTLPTSASLVTARGSGMRYGMATAAVAACAGAAGGDCAEERQDVGDCEEKERGRRMMGRRGMRGPGSC